MTGTPSPSSSAATRAVSTTWRTGSPAAARTPPTSPRRRSCGCSRGSTTWPGARSTCRPTSIARPATSSYDRSSSAVRARRRSEEIAGAAGADETMEADPQLTALVSAQGGDVRAANARLPERHRLVLALRELEDMSYEDIGRVLDITPGAVAQLLGRARMAPAPRAAPAAGSRRRDGSRLPRAPRRDRSPDRRRARPRPGSGADAAPRGVPVVPRGTGRLRGGPRHLPRVAAPADPARPGRRDGPGGGGARARALRRRRRGGGGGRRGPLAGRGFGSGRRILVGSLALLLLLGVSTVVGVRSASDDPVPEPPAPGSRRSGRRRPARRRRRRRGRPPRRRHDEGLDERVVRRSARGPRASARRR